jgi:hypothetical protein
MLRSMLRLIGAHLEGTFRYASNFIMPRRLVEVKTALMSMVVGDTWAEWRQVDSERGSKVQRVLIDEDWWSKI